MPIKDWFKKPEKEEEITDIESDSKAVIDFLSTARESVKKIQPLLKEFAKLRKLEEKLKEKNADEILLKKNLSAQIKAFDRILSLYELFNLDADISADRIKKIAKALKTSAEELALEEEIMDKIRREERWTYNW